MEDDSTQYLHMCAFHLVSSPESVYIEQRSGSIEEVAAIAASQVLFLKMHVVIKSIRYQCSCLRIRYRRLDAESEFTCGLSDNLQRCH